MPLLDWIVALSRTKSESNVGQARRKGRSVITIIIIDKPFRPTDPSITASPRSKVLCMRRLLASPDAPAICPPMAAFLAALNGPQSCMTCSQCKTAVKLDGSFLRRLLPYPNGGINLAIESGTITGSSVSRCAERVK